MKKQRLLFFALFCTLFVPVLAAQTTVAPFVTSEVQLMNNSGQPLAGGCIFFFAAGTSNPQPTFTDSTGTVQASNPVVLDSAGRAAIWMSGLAYKIQVKTSGGVNCASGVQLWVQDNVTWTTPLSTFAGLSVSGAFNITQPTAATLGANQSSFLNCLHGTYWNGSASTDDKWCWQDVLPNGTNPTSTLTLQHTGSSGVTTIDLTSSTNLKAGALTAGSVNSAGPNPWIDPTHPTYGAKCDGVTDDTAAFNAAITAAQVGNGTNIRIPVNVVCVIAGQLSADSTRNFAIVAQGGLPLGSTDKSILLFTGTTSPLVKLRTSAAIRIEGVNFIYNNNAFSGRLVDFEPLVSSSSFNITIRNASVGGTLGGAGGAICLLCLDSANVVEIDDVHFSSAVNGIRLSNSNNVHIYDSQFSTAPGNPGAITGAFILQAGASTNTLVIGPNNTFEMNNAGGASTPTIYDGTAGGLTNLSVVNNTTNDLPAGYSGTEFKSVPSGASFIGNSLAGGSSNLATLVTIPTGTQGLTAFGNTIHNFATAFSMAGTLESAAIVGNTCSSITTFLSGTPGSGFSSDCNNVLSLYVGTQNILVNSGGNKRVSLGSNNGLGLALGSAIGFTGTSDPNAVFDTAVSRIAANVLGAGTSNGDVSGEFRSAKISATYNAAGTVQTAVHIVQDTCTLGTNCGVTLSGSAAFTNSTSYSCSCTDQTSAAACRGNQTAGNAVTFTGTGTDVLRYVCVGN